MHEKYFVALGALSAALAACGGEVGPPSGAGAGAGTGSGAGTSVGGSAGSGSGATGGSTAATGGTGTGGAGGGTAGTSSGGSAGTVGSTETCVPGVPATSQFPRLKNRQYDAVIYDLLGVRTLAGAGDKAPSSLLADDSDGNMTQIAWNSYLLAADTIASEVMAGANKARFISCEPSTAACLENTIRSFGRKAFRRPVTDAEVASFMRLHAVTPAGTPNDVAEAILYTFLASPSFIALPELAQKTATEVAGALELSPHEVATRLSFLLWNTVPDQALNEAADAGQLSTREQILAQAQRMVMDRARTAPVVASFHRVYADIRQGSHWNDISHDTTKYPLYSDAIKAPMMAELDAFFEEVAFAGGSFEDLFLSNVAYVNSNTAAIYGLDPASFGPELTRVTLDATQRPGFLTRVGFLSSFSSFGSTSPILRGAYVSKNIIGIHIEDPPPEAAETPVPPGVYETQREIVENHTAAPKCQGCHSNYINPAGFVLETYDSIGKWQTVDPLGGAIDPTADVLFSEDNIKTITSPLELMTELSRGEEARRKYTEQWVTFATGRVPNANDACLVNDLMTKLATDGYTILNLLTDLTQADSFRLRTVGN